MTSVKLLRNKFTFKHKKRQQQRKVIQQQYYQNGTKLKRLARNILNELIKRNYYISTKRQFFNLKCKLCDYSTSNKFNLLFHIINNKFHLFQINNKFNIKSRKYSLIIQSLYFILLL